MPAITILYIASPSYSGSTLLSRLLHAHSLMISVGEQRVLSKSISRTLILEERQCSCGTSPLKSCPFWQEIATFLNKKHQLNLETLDLNTLDETKFKIHNAAFFAAIQQVSGKNIIVDSSKNWERLMRLKKAGFTVIPIRLQRQPLGVINSAIKYGHPWLKQTLNYLYYYQKLYDIIGSATIRVDYEQLTLHPQKTLQNLMGQLGYRFEEEQLNWAATPTHYIGGNPMRYQKESTIKLDQKWQKELSWWKKISIQSLMLFYRLPEAWQFKIFNIFSKVSRSRKINP